MLIRKTLAYSAFVIASLFVVLVFLTTQTAFQLALAVGLYPILVYFAFRTFPRKSWKPTIIVPQEELHTPESKVEETVETQKESLRVADIDKRAFLKIIGATGISFFLLSLLGRRADNFFSGNVGQFGSGGQQATPSPTDGYKISEIDEGVITYYGFINKDGGWLIMREDSGTNNFRYAKGGSDFPGNWSNREKLRFDYFYNLK